MEETGLGQSFLACCHVGVLELEEMHDAQVNLPDRGRIIVDQADAADIRPGLATSTSSSSSRSWRLVSIRGFCLPGHRLRRRARRRPATAAGAAGPLPVISARVAENSVSTAEDHIRNDLLVAGVVFDLRSWPILHQLGNESAFT